MSHLRVYSAFALPMSLVLACAACGQGNPGQPIENQPPPAATAPTPDDMNNPAMNPPPAATAGTMAPGMAGSTGMANGSAGAADFGALAGSKGYITQADAMKDHWLNTHFEECDSDHDGKITRAEYEACTRNGAGSMQPTPAGSTG